MSKITVEVLKVERWDVTKIGVNNGSVEIDDLINAMNMLYGILGELDPQFWFKRITVEISIREDSFIEILSFNAQQL